MKSSLPKINQVILIIVIVQFLLTAAFGFMSPFFAVFVTAQIVGGTVAVVGFAITVYWVTKSVLQLLVARYIDKNHGEIDDFYFYLAGGFLNAIFVSLYYFASEPLHIYILHFLIGIADAMLVPPFYAIFSRHLDKGQEGFEWATYSSFSLGAGSAIGAAVGGVLATLIGFRAVFLIIGMLAFVTSLILLFLRPYILPKIVDGRPRLFIDKTKA